MIAKIDYSDTYISGTQTSGQVFILLIDPATGNPTNGYGVVISYEQNINGVIYEGQVTIQGQSASIYSGLLSDQDPSHFYFTKFQITDIGTGHGGPSGNGCDLTINRVSIDNSESAPGAADGQITIYATSGNGFISYSLDNVSFQTTPTFSGLSTGAMTAYVTDPDGCSYLYPFFLPAASNLLVADPSVNLTGGNISRWNAAFNPVVFTYQRKDFQLTGVTRDTLTMNATLSVNCNTGPIKIAIDANNQAIKNAAALGVVLTDNNPVYIYLSSDIYKGTFRVLSVPTAGQLVIDTPFVDTASGYVNINLLRPYYQVRTQIASNGPLSGQSNVIISTNRPNNTGLVKADISNFLQSLLRAKDDSNFTQINYNDSNLSASYTIAYTEYWDGKLSGDSILSYTQIANPYYVVYAAKQLGERYGGNLAAYVPFRSVTDDSQLAKWITDFAQPSYSNGYPFDIGFIYSEALVGVQVYCVLTQLDINGNPLPGGLQTNYLLNDDSSWLLNQDGSKFIISNQTTESTQIPATLGLNRLLVNANFGNEVHYFTLVLKYDDGDATHTITQTQTVRIDDAVDENSVYLRWIGLSGSWNYYRFVYNQEVSLDVQNAVIIKNYVADWENQDGIEEVIGKSAGQKIKVLAEDLSVADIKGLQSIKYSPKVQMLVNRNPVKWQTIVLNTATFSEYETQNGQAPFSVTFNLPSINIQTQ